jgi:aspartate/methionine/tyrosine aminotransferase
MRRQIVAAVLATVCAVTSGCATLAALPWAEVAGTAGAVVQAVEAYQAAHGTSGGVSAAGEEAVARAVAAGIEEYTATRDIEAAMATAADYYKRDTGRDLGQDLLAWLGVSADQLEALEAFRAVVADVESTSAG